MADKNMIGLGIIDLMLAVIITLLAYFVAMTFDRYAGELSVDFMLVDNFETSAIDIEGTFGTVDFSAIVLERNSIKLFSFAKGIVKQNQSVNNLQQLGAYARSNAESVYVIYETQPSSFLDPVIREFATSGINVGVAKLAK